MSATDLQVGENIGQNTPAETARTLNENGARVYSAIYKRTWRSERDDYRVQYELNALYLEADVDYVNLTSGQGAMIRPDDYHGDKLDVRPAADPHVVSDTQRIDQARLVFQNAITVPGHNRYQATLRLYKAMQIPAIDEILPPPMMQGPDGKPQPAKDFPPAPNPKVMAQQLEQQKFQFEQLQWQAEQQQVKMELQMEVGKNQAEIMKLYAQAEKALAEAKGVDTGHQIALIEAQIGALKTRNEGLLKALEIIQKGMERDKNGNEGAGMAGMGAASANQGILQIAGGNGQAGPAVMGAA